MKIIKLKITDKFLDKKNSGKRKKYNYYRNELTFAPSRIWFNTLQFTKINYYLVTYTYHPISINHQIKLNNKHI